jgi:hypothetical protein
VQLTVPGLLLKYRIIATVARTMTRSANAITVAIVVSGFNLAACSSAPPPQPHTAAPSQSARQPSVSASAAPTATLAPGNSAAPHATGPCLGLSICPTPPPDAEGNPACNYRDGWDADPSGSGIDVNYFPESAAAATGEQITVDVRLKDGTVASQIAAIEPGQSFHHIQFPGIEKSAVHEVLLANDAGRCFVIGPDGT